MDGEEAAGGMAEEWRPGEEWAKRMRDRDEWRGSRGIRMSRDVGWKGLAARSTRRGRAEMSRVNGVSGKG